jgi:hypothetical protein
MSKKMRRRHLELLEPHQMMFLLKIPCCHTLVGLGLAYAVCRHGGEHFAELIFQRYPRMVPIPMVSFKV